MKNYYEILEVNENASKEVIDKVYKVLAKKYHPDLQQISSDKKNAEEKLKEINEAYAVLSDDFKRKKYDEELNSRRNSNPHINSNGVGNSKYSPYAVNQTEKNIYNEKENSSQNENGKLNRKIKKQQRKLEKKYKKKLQDEYLKSYGDYLRKNGYRVKYKMDYRKIPILLAFIGGIILIGWLLWIIPITHKYIEDFYNNNIIIQRIFRILFHS